MRSIRFSYGPAASHTYLEADGGESQLTLDWSYNKMYLKEPNTPWITLSLDETPHLANNTRETLICLLEGTLQQPQLQNSPYPDIATAYTKASQINTRLKSVLNGFD